MSDFIDTLPPWPEDDLAAFGQVEVKPRSRIQQLVGRFLHRNWLRIPHVTHHDDIDVTDNEQRRLEWNAAHPDARISPVVALVKAVASILPQHPSLCSSLDQSGQKLVTRHYVHIGVAVEVPSGLLVPVIRDCDSRSMREIAADLADLVSRARGKGLPMTDMTGASISISSLGHIGGTGFTPIVNAPESAILGVSRLREVARRGSDGGLEWRQMLPLSLSYDHRIVNGADAARFVSAIGAAMQNLIFE